MLRMLPTVRGPVREIENKRRRRDGDVGGREETIVKGGLDPGDSSVPVSFVKVSNVGVETRIGPPHLEEGGDGEASLAASSGERNVALLEDLEDPIFTELFFFALRRRVIATKRAAVRRVGRDPPVRGAGTGIPSPLRSFTGRRHIGTSVGVRLIRSRLTLDGVKAGELRGPSPRGPVACTGAGLIERITVSLRSSSSCNLSVAGARIPARRRDGGAGRVLRAGRRSPGSGRASSRRSPANTDKGPSRLL